MPLFDFKCPKCETKHEDVFVQKYDETHLCSCGTECERLFPNRFGPANFGWPEGGVTMEHVGPEPVHFATRREAANYAKEHNMELGCL